MPEPGRAESQSKPLSAGRGCGPAGVALGVALVLGLLPTLPAQIEDPPPAETELLILPGPDQDPAGPGNADPFELLPTMPDSLGITNDGSISFDNAAGIVKYNGDVRILADNGIQIFADHAVIDTKRKFVTITGNVSVYQGTVLHRGESATYHYDSKQLDAGQLRTSLDPILLEAGRFRTVDQNGRQIFIGENAGVTTHDEENPGYWLRAKETTIIPGERVIFRNMKLYAGDQPIFWLPYLSQPTDRELGYHFVPGAKSNWGPFILNTYGLMLNGEEDPVTGFREGGWLLAKFHADILTRRGLGTGVDLIDTRLEDNPNLGWLKLYYIHDFDPSLDRGGIPRGFVNEDRFRVQLRHRLYLDFIPGGETYAEADITLLSDEFFLEDFDRSAFSTEPNPDNILALVHQRDRNVLTLWTRMRLNDFYQSDTRYPEIAFDQVKSPIFGSRVLHEGQTLLGLYDEYLPDFTRDALSAESSLPATNPERRADIANTLADRGFSRFHTWQEFSAPMKVGHVNINPRIGAGYTNYSSVEGPVGSENRSHFYAGIDTSIKFSRQYSDIHNKRWGLDGLLHVIQPYASLSFLSTDELEPNFGKIDRLTASTRPRPLTVGRFTAIDDLDDWAIARFGVRNRLLTRRDSSSHEWLTLDTYIDWFMDDPEYDRDVSNLYNDLHWYPVPWLNVALETQFPMLNTEDDFTEIAGSVRFMPSEDLEIAFRTRFLNNHPVLENSTLLEFQAYQRINDDWGAGMTQRWEFDDGTLEYQSYSLHHHFDSWAISTGIFFRDNRFDDEYGFVVGFTLKDFPSLSLPLKVGAD